MLCGVQAIGRSWMSPGEDKFAFLCTVCAIWVFAAARDIPAKEVLRREWFAIVVDAEEATVEIETRKLEVVGVTTEECNRCFGRENQADIAIGLVAVEVKSTPLIQGDDFALQAGRLCCRVFDRCNRGASRSAGFGEIGHIVRGFLDARRDIFDRPERIEF